jgi:hypothetical protein
MTITRNQLIAEYELSEEDFGKTLWACHIKKEVEELDDEQEGQFRLIREYFSSGRIKNYKEASDLIRKEKEETVPQEAFLATDGEADVSELVRLLDDSAEATMNGILKKVAEMHQCTIREAADTYMFSLAQRVKALTPEVLQAEILKEDQPGNGAPPRLGLRQAMEGRWQEQRVLPGS